MTHHHCNLDVWTLAQSCGDGHRSLVTHKRVLSEYNEDLIFFSFFLLLEQIIFSSDCIMINVLTFLKYMILFKLIDYSSQKALSICLITILYYVFALSETFSL